jgi:DNA-binding FrmR family transcriptional regulator
MTSPAGQLPAVDTPVEAATEPSGKARGASWFRSEDDGPAMELDASDMGKVINRLKRAQGQLAGVVRMLEEGRGCEDIVTQLSAVGSALDRAGFAIVASGLRQCLIESDGKETLHVQKLEKIFLSLA